MRAYGYKKNEIGNGLLELKEVTISANSDVLRKIADFILECAKNIEKDPDRWSHEHFKAEDKNPPEFIISNPRAK